MSEYGGLPFVLVSTTGACCSPCAPGALAAAGALAFPTRRTRVVPVLLLDSYPDPVFPPDVELGVFRLGEQLFHGGAGVVGGVGGRF